MISSNKKGDITGQLVANYNSISANQEINVENLGTGIYLVKIKDIHNVYQTKKIVVE
jgi:hypothetical protein